VMKYTKLKMGIRSHTESVTELYRKARLHSSRSLMLLLLMAFSLCSTQLQQTRAGAPAPAT
jgi:hypothetical protein